jgi:hypothetical protein
MSTTNIETATPAKGKVVRRASEEMLHSKQQTCERTQKFWDGESNIVPGSARFETEGSHANKQTVLIKTVGADGKPDGEERRVATSDLHQVHHQPAVAEELKKANRRAKAKARREKAKAALERLAELEAAQG